MSTFKGGHGLRTGLSQMCCFCCEDSMLDTTYRPNRQKTCLAKALYDNIAETPDELAFRRGDVLTIIEQDTNGLEGWWLCSLRGKQGIVPGNRLKLISGVYDPGSQGQPAYPTPPRGYEGGNLQQRRSWTQFPNKVITPQKVGSVYVFNQPARGHHDYDVPPPRHFPVDAHGSPARSKPAAPVQKTPQKSRSPYGLQHVQALYDVLPTMPRKETQAPAFYDVLPPHAGLPVDEKSLANRLSNTSVLSTGSTRTVSSSVSNQSLPVGSAPPSACGSARSSIEIPAQEIYDIPPTQPRPVDTKSQLQKSKSDPSILDTYDSPPAAKPIDRDSARCFSGDYESLKLEAYHSGEKYDSPRRHSENRGVDSGLGRLEVYDVPPPTSSVEHAIDDLYSVPTNNAPTALPKHEEYVGTVPSGQNSDAECVYDIPPQVTRDSAISMKSDTSSADDGSSRLSTCSMDSRGSDIPFFPYDELPLELDAALELLVKRQQDVQSAASKLLSFVTSTWTQKDNLEPKLYDVKTSCFSLSNALREFVDFGQGTVANSVKAEDKKLVKKLVKQLEPLQDSLLNLCKCVKSLEDMQWLVFQYDNVRSATMELEAIAALAKDLPSVARALSSLIQGNSTLLFQRAQKIEDVQDDSGSPSEKVKPPVKSKPLVAPKPERKGSMQERPLPPVPVDERRLPGATETTLQTVPKEGGEIPTYSAVPKKPVRTPDSDNDYENDTKDWLEDYDYVHLDRNKGMAGKPGEDNYGYAGTESQQLDLKPPEIKTIGLTPKFKERLEKLKSEAEKPVNTFQMEDTPESRRLSRLQEIDKQILNFYTAQMETHAASLTNAIDAFFASIEYNQPPKVFIAHSKFVVLAAHKLVYIGDTIHRTVSSEEVQSKTTLCANKLCECLKQTVTMTKNAALQFPSVTAMQEMVDRVTDVSHAADELKNVVQQAAQLGD